MKRSELFFSFLLLPLDFLMIFFAGITAYQIRFAEFAQAIRPVLFNLSIEQFLPIVAVISVSWIVIFALAGLYNIRSNWPISKEIYRIILACSTGLTLIVVYIFIKRELFDSRFIVLAGWLISILYIIIARAIIRHIQASLYKKGIGLHKVVLVGDSKTTDILIGEFSRNKKRGYEVVKRVKDFSLETSQEMADLIKLKEVDEIIQTDPNLTKPEIIRMYDFADENHLTFKYAADLLETKVLKTEVVEIAGIPVVEVKKTTLDGWGRIMKRIFDITGSVLLLLLLSPILLIVALLIKLDSPGPVFYLDYRSGQHNKRFLFYKFRSMLAHLCDGEGPGATEEGNIVLNKLVNNAALNTRTDSGPLHKIKNDPRITRVGHFIRRWSLDELPQLINVVKGEMSLVGPRPHMTMQTARYEAHHKKVFTIKPGITGLAQISGRSDLSFEEEIKLDTYYIENWSMLLDLSIILRTPLAVFRHRKAE